MRRREFLGVLGIVAAMSASRHAVRATEDPSPRFRSFRHPRRDAHRERWAVLGAAGLVLLTDSVEKVASLKWLQICQITNDIFD
jgi:hypothetical protein